jgi:hypothetical protein
MTLSSIYPLPQTPDLGRLIKEKYPAEHSRSPGRAGRLKIDCLLNDPAVVFCKLASSGSECESKIAFPRMEQKRCCTENTAAMFARIGTVTDVTPEP